MRQAFHALTTAMDGDELLTTGEAAALLGVSRQHVVDLIDRGDLPAARVGTHRRVRRGDLLEVRRGSSRLTRDQERSLWLGIAVAGKFVRDPARVRDAARKTLAGMRGNRWTREWADLLEGPAVDILRALSSDSVHARELRQNSPFAGVLSDTERQRVLAEFRDEGRR
ncbi:helix-turn-helix domain-containing protein [Microbacterium sp. 179-I 3D3 NHS]|uniref:helix-turn-helix domain-containing protein n=1 Tax=Microbacterium sp. 179-I 3D3 NHS TaxID=3142382 RepID=UPI0039A0F0CF